MKTLSVFLNVDSIYITIINVEDNKAILEYINSTNHHLDLENTDSPESQNALKEMDVILSNLPFKLDRLTITIPAESIFISKFPGQLSFSKEQLQQLVKLELRNAYPKLNYEDFVINATTIKPELNQKESMLGMIYLKSDIEFLENWFKKYNLNIDNIEISPLAAYSSFMFNYPEMRDNTIFLIGYQGKFVDFSIHKNGETLYYNINLVTDANLIGELTEKEFNKITENAASQIDACYFYGSCLNKNITLSLWETSMMLGILEAKRLNPLRMITPNLDKRHIEYCSRTFHIYPPCIGSALKSWHNLIKF